MDSEPPPMDAELLQDVDDVRRVQRAVGTYVIAFAITSPIWLMLLLVLPRTGIGAGLSLLFASLVATGVALYGRSWFLRNAGVRAREGGTTVALTLSPAVKRTMLVCAGLILLYVVLVTRAG
ncbi:MAG: hypothetical protein IT200_06330 [Thermoleophilia bacterium]|nr:hypothetical protein [Thermoleophilia bacterium]